MSRVLLSIVIAAFLAGSLAGCGRKGPPEVPAGQVDTLKNKYPRPEPGDIDTTQKNPATAPAPAQ